LLKALFLAIPAEYNTVNDIRIEPISEPVQIENPGNFHLLDASLVLWYEFYGSGALDDLKRTIEKLRQSMNIIG
jgi:hypothetical protein